MSFSTRVFRAPRYIARGQVGTGWLGFVSSWVVLGFGVAILAASGGRLFSVGEGACAGSDDVCTVGALGGVITGAGAVLVAVLFSVMIARGFGPPTLWWGAPLGLAALGAIPVIAALAGRDAVDAGLFVAGVLVLVVAAALVIVMLRQWRLALAGWTRFDGLDVREVAQRSHELVLFPLIAAGAALAGGAFGVHVSALLASG